MRSKSLTIIVPYIASEPPWHLLLSDLEVYAENIEIIIALPEIIDENDAVSTRLYLKDAIIIRKGRRLYEYLNAALEKATGEYVWFLMPASRVGQNTFSALKNFIQGLTSQDATQNIITFTHDYLEGGSALLLLHPLCCRIFNWLGWPIVGSGWVMLRNHIAFHPLSDEEVFIEYRFRLKRMGYKTNVLKEKIWLDPGRLNNEGITYFGIGRFFVIFKQYFILVEK